MKSILDYGEYQCCFCGKVFRYRPHNAEPLYKGNCCNVCNKVVVAIRIYGSLIGAR